MAQNKIEYAGETNRFRSQKIGRLVNVEAAVARSLDNDLLEFVGKDISSDSARTYIVCTYIGERRIPFVDIIGYGGSRLLKLQSSIGQIFEIDYPVVEKQTEIELESKEVKE